MTDAAQWTATALRHGIPYSLCDGTYIVGGYDVLGYPDSLPGVQGYYFQRVYNDLPDHDIIYYTISLWLIDSWDAEPPDIFQLQFDSVLVEGWTFGFGNFTERLCGIADWADLKNMTVFGQVSHTGPSLTLRVISQLDSFALDESLGFRDVHLIFAKRLETNVNELCGLSPLPLPSNQCGCPYGEYFDDIYTFGCVSCDPSCRSCFGGTSQECYECEMGYSSVGSECIKCNESCADCSGPSANQCTDCFEGMSLFDGGICLSGCVSTSLASETILVCDSPCLAGEFYDSQNQLCVNPCDALGGFLYWDGTCNSLCEFPLQDDQPLCLFPCDPNEFLYWDGLCNETCDGSLTPSMYKNRLFCQHPCGEIADFIYWNGSCGSDCPSPYVNSSDGKANYCSLPCSEEQPYWDGSSCLNSCSPPFQVKEENGILSCEYPCSSSEYLHWDGTCIDSCPTPYEVCAIGPGMQFCSYLCKQYGEYYYPKDGQCLPTCDGLYHPEVQISLDGAWYVACVKKTMGKQPPEGNEDNQGPPGPLYFPITAIRIASEKAVSVFIALDIVVSLLRDSHVMILILMIKILNFMRYVDIRIPSQLMQETKTFDHNFYYLNFGPSMSGRMQEKFTKSPLPIVFERTGLHSRFLVNFFKPITSFLILLGFVTVILILRNFLQRRTRQEQYILIKMILRRMEIFLKWNLVVLLVICNIDQITLYGILEWKTITTGSDQDSVSLLISLGMAVLSVSVVIAPFYLLDKIYQTRFKVLSNQANEPYFNLLKKIEGFQVLWKDFKDSSGLQKAFLPLYMLRIASVYMIIGLLYKHPLIQMVLIFLVSLGMLIYMSVVKPFMKTLDFIQSIIYEVAMLISVGSMLILAALDRAHAKADQVWLFLGGCVQFCNILISLTAILFFVCKLFLELQRVWRFYKMLPKPVSLGEFAILFLKEDDPVIQELNKNKRTSRKLDLTNVEREIERKNFERYNIKFISPEETGPNGEGQLSYIPRKGELRIRRSLFGVKIQSSDSENSPFKTNTTLDEVQSPRSVSMENFTPSKKIFSQTGISQELSSDNLQIENEGLLLQASNKSDKLGEEKTPKRGKFIWKGLETIKELDSMEGTEIKNGLQTKRLGNIGKEDLSFLSVVNKRLSSETMMRKIEEMEIIKEKDDVVKKKLTTAKEVKESLFE